MRTRTHSRSTLTKATNKAMFEQLDSRQMFSTLTLNGTAGPDLITLDYANGNFIYVINGGFSQVSDAGVTNIVVNGLGGDDTIQLERNAGLPTILSGGDNNDTINLSATFKNLSNFSGSVQVQGGAGNDIVNYIDSDVVGTQNYEVNHLNVKRNGSTVAHYASDVETLTLTTGKGADNVAIPQTDDKTVVELNSAAGNDVVDVGGASGLSTIQSDITIRNTPAFTTLSLDDTGNNTGRTVSFNVASLPEGEFGTITGFNPSFGADVRYKMSDTASGIAYTGGSGADTIDIHRTTSKSLVINGGDGADVFRTGGGAPNAVISNIDASISLVGGSDQGDLLELRDAGQTNPNAFTITPNVVSGTLMANIAYSGFKEVVLYTGTSGATHNIENTASGTRLGIVDGSGSHDYNVKETAVDSPVRIVNTNQNDGVFINTGNVGHATVEFTNISPQTVGQLYIYDGGKAVVGVEQDGAATAGDRVLKATDFIVGTNGVLEVQNNAFIFDYTGPNPFSVVESHVKEGFNSGAWNGLKVRTNRGEAGKFGLGYANSSDVVGPNGGSFAGTQVDGSSVLVRFTRAGDANLDGQVNLDDFTRLAAKFGSTGTWSQGNFDYNSQVNLDDFTILAANFGTTLSADAARAGNPAASVFSSKRIIDDVMA